MAIGQALILGTVQGLTEFLPISSSGHLIFIPQAFGWVDQGLAFDVVVHLGTLVAVVVYFRKRLKMLLKWYILLSVIPAGLAGFLFGDWIEAHTRSAAVVAWSLIGWGVVLGVADYVSREHRKHKNTENTKTQKTLANLTWRNVLFIAGAQAIALIPGTSRSGITMTAGLFSRLDKKSAVEFSFLMAIPVIALAGAVQLTEFGAGASGQFAALPLMAGFLSALASGLAAIWGLMKIIQKWSFMPFVVYRVAVGAVILIWM